MRWTRPGGSGVVAVLLGMVVAGCGRPVTVTEPVSLASTAVAVSVGGVKALRWVDPVSVDAAFAPAWLSDPAGPRPGPVAGVPLACRSGEAVAPGYPGGPLGPGVAVVRREAGAGEEPDAALLGWLNGGGLGGAGPRWLPAPGIPWAAVRTAAARCGLETGPG